MPAPVIRVEEISFSFEGSKALPLVEGQQRVVSPEWQLDRAARPVAYVKSDLEGGFKIRVTFSCRPHTNEMWVRTVRRDFLPRAIGEVPETLVRFPAGIDRVVHTCDVGVRDLSAVHLERVTWQWQVKDGDTWTDANVTVSDIALTLGKPTEPWSVDPAAADRQLPWWGVLRRACFVASGAQTAKEAATKLAETIYGVWGGTFYEWGPANTYASDAGTMAAHFFDCARFIRLIEGSREPSLVDCSDVASALSTFANILGCNLKQIFVGGGIIANRVLPSGHLNWRGRLPFGIHEFTIEERRASNRLVWDGCLKLTRDAEGPKNVSPEETPRTAFLPVGMVPKDYLNVLRFDQSTNIDKEGSEPSIRPIREPSQRSEPASEEEPLVRAGREIAPWLLEPVTDQPLIRDLDLNMVVVTSWRRAPPIIDSLAASEELVEKVLKPLWIARDDSGCLLACDVFITTSSRQARLRALAIVGRSRVESVRRVDVPGVEGEVLVVSEDGSLAIAIVGNVVIAARRASREAFVVSADHEVLTAVRRALRP